MKEPKAFREKEEIEPGAILSSVERDKVWLTRGNEREKLEILPVGSGARPTAAGASGVASPVASATSRSSQAKTEALVVGAKAPPPVAVDDEGDSPRERRRRSRGTPR
jgi:hypothetical protein